MTNLAALSFLIPTGHAILHIGLMMAACSNALEGMGKDLQNMGNAMGGSGANSTQQNQSQTHQTGTTLFGPPSALALTSDNYSRTPLFQR